VRVIRDVVRRYDIDGVHIDDYFYRTGSATRSTLRFPSRRRELGAIHGVRRTAEREDCGGATWTSWWSGCTGRIKQEKPWVKFGISPSASGAPGYPREVTTTFDPYEQLYADALKWWTNGAGWTTSTPQLYWPIARPDLSYPILLRWWASRTDGATPVARQLSQPRGLRHPRWRSDEVLGQGVRHARAARRHRQRALQHACLHAEPGQPG
jgi:uncharacterized lipoprotein YddW (UPF0748 family)